jgi:cell division protein FtsB
VAQARPAPPPLVYQWARVRWDRIGRTALLIVLAVVAGLYVQHIVEFFVTRANAGTQHALVRRLVRENASLRAQSAALQQPATIKRYARALGMVRSGERPYVVLGLPGH